MNIYKAPNSDVGKNNLSKPEFVKFYLLGIGYTFIITFVVSIIFSLSAAALLGYDLSKQTDLEASYNDPLLLMFDLVVTAACLYLSGFISAKYLISNYIYHGGILGIIILVLFVMMLHSINGFEQMPFWYNFLSLFIIIPSVALGAFKRKS